MTDIEENLVPSHVELLREQLFMRQQKNPRFSLRAFADMLQMHPSALSRILSGKQELSVGACISILKKLRIDEMQKDEFILSVIKEKTEKLKTQLLSARFATDQLI